MNAGWLLCTMCHRPDGADPLTPGGGRVKPNESPAASAPEAASPFPPAFRWEVSPQEAPTQVMRAVGRDTAQGGVGRDTAQGDAVEATQEGRTGDVGDYGRTQVVRPTPSPPQRPDEVRDLFQPVDTPLQEPIYRPSDSSAPPWVDSDRPPLAEQQSAWLHQGPRGFEAPAMQSWSRHIIGITVLALVVLGLVGAAVAYSLTARSPDQPGSAQVAPQPPAAPPDLPAPPAPLPAPVDTAHALIEPPGQLRGGGGPFDLAQLESTNLVPRPILIALQAGGMTDGLLKTTTAGSTTIGMFAFTMPDQKAATVVARTIAAVQYDGGLLADNHRALQGVTVLGSAPGPPSTVYRAVYVLYNRVIYFEVFGPNRDAVLTTVDFLINQQVNYAPPTVSGG